MDGSADGGTLGYGQTFTVTQGSARLPAIIRGFLHSRIESLEQLEILLALRQDSRSVTARAVARQLGLSDAVARDGLERLAGRGLLSVKLGATDIMYRYDAVSDDLRRAVDLLADCYATSRTAVLTFVTGRSR